MKNYIFLFLLLLVNSFSFSQTSIATYTIIFNSNWSNTTHPSSNFPDNAHWSKLVGATHNENIVFIEAGQLASEGVENVAELGNNALFFSEIDNAINNGFANQIIDGDDLPTPLGTITISNIVTTEEFPLLTLISMIAPSPDWIMTINNISLLGGNGEWLDELTLEVYPYDAGTDSGTDYNSLNNNTNPKEPITSLQGVASFSYEIIGTITISIENVVLRNENFQKDTISIYPNPARNFTTISNFNSKIRSLEVFNILGERVKVIKLNNASDYRLNLSEYSNGIYLIKIDDSNGNATLKKLIKH